MPTIVDNGKVVRESTVIMEYLDDEYPNPSLRPSNSHARAQMRLWTKRLDEGHHDIATATLSMGIAFRFQYLEKGRDACDALINRIPDPLRRERRRDVIYNGVEAKEFKTAVRMWEALLTDMEKALDGSRWLADDEYSLRGRGLHALSHPSRSSESPRLDRKTPATRELVRTDTRAAQLWRCNRTMGKPQVY